VRTRILDICRRYLSAKGVAYISYNTYPGFHKRQAVREILRYHTRGISDPAAAVREARRMLDVLARSIPDRAGSYGRGVAEEAAKLAAAPDSYFFHEHLEVENQAFYFHEFMAAAHQHGLEFLTEAQRLGSFADLKADYRELAPADADAIAREQYVDFVRNRALRRTLLVRSGVPRGPEGVTRDLAALGSATPLDEPSPSGATRFRSAAGDVAISHPGLRHLLLALHEHQPIAVPTAALPEEAFAELGYAYSAGLCELRTGVPPVVASPGERPLVSASARPGRLSERGAEPLARHRQADPTRAGDPHDARRHARPLRARAPDAGRAPAGQADAARARRHARHPR
jgi:hypothetical protein